MKVYVSVILLLLAGSLSAQTNGDTAPGTAAPNTSQTSATASVQSKIDPAKEADIRRLMQVTGVEDLMTQILKPMTEDARPMLNKMLPPVPSHDKIIDLFFAKFQAKANIPHLLDLIVPIYDKYFSSDDIKGLIKFYESPLGKKVTTVMPQVIVESQAAGRNWGQTLGQESMTEVMAEHPEFAKELEDAKKSTQP